MSSAGKSERPSGDSGGQRRESKIDKAKKAVVKAVRKGQLLIYVMGGANLCYAIALLGAVCFNGLFDADNKWVFLRRGPWQTLHAVAVSICVLAIFGLVAAIVATFFRVKFPDRFLIQLVCWIVSYVLAFITLILEAVAIANSLYGDDWVPDVLAGHRAILWGEYNYPETDPEFAAYVQRSNAQIPPSLRSTYFPYLPIPNAEYLVNRSAARGGPPNPLAGAWGGDRLIAQSILPLPDSWHFLIDAMQPFGYRPADGQRYVMGLVPPCRFDWDTLASGTLSTDGNPCDYNLGEALECVGKWTASKYKQFWCEQYKQITSDQKWKSSKSPSFSDIEHRAARRILPKHTIDSVGAWNQMNGYLLGLLVVSFIFSVVTVILDLKYGKAAAEASDADKRPKA